MQAGININIEWNELSSVCAEGTGLFLEDGSVDNCQRGEGVELLAYKIFYRNSSGPDDIWSHSLAPGSTRNWIITGLEKEVKYVFRISAVNSEHEGTPSDEVEGPPICELCDAGTSSIDGKRQFANGTCQDCMDCSPGYYSPSPGATTCLQCPSQSTSLTASKACTVLPLSTPPASWVPLVNAKNCSSDSDCIFEGCSNRPCSNTGRPDLTACIGGAVWEHRCMAGYCYHADDCVPDGCLSGHLYRMCATSGPRTSDWGKVEFDHCVQPYTWSEITRASKDLARTGGLGKLLQVNGFETWLCVCDHSCALEFSTDPQDSWFCFVYHEANDVFTPWGPNSLLKLVSPSACRTNSSTGE